MSNSNKQQANVAMTRETVQAKIQHIIEMQDQLDGRIKNQRADWHVACSKKPTKRTLVYELVFGSAVYQAGKLWQAVNVSSTEAEILEALEDITFGEAKNTLAADLERYNMALAFYVKHDEDVAAQARLAEASKQQASAPEPQAEVAAPKAVKEPAKPKQTYRERMIAEMVRFALTSGLHTDVEAVTKLVTENYDKNHPTEKAVKQPGEPKQPRVKAEKVVKQPVDLVVTDEEAAQAVQIWLGGTYYGPFGLIAEGWRVLLRKDGLYVANYNTDPDGLWRRCISPKTGVEIASKTTGHPGWMSRGHYAAGIGYVIQEDKRGHYVKPEPKADPATPVVAQPQPQADLAEQQVTVESVETPQVADAA